MEAARNDFNHARIHLENTPELVDRATPEVKLKLFGLYKQATCGDCTEASPSIFNVKAKVKHDAWSAQHGLSADDAFRTYAKLITELDPSFQLPSQNVARRARTVIPIQGAGGSSSSLSALTRTESKDFLDRLLGPPARLISPSHSDANLAVRALAEEDVEERSSTDSGAPLSQNSKKKLSLMIGRSGSLEELRRLEEAASSSSSVVTGSTPTTPQNSSSGPGGARVLGKSPSLSWGKAEDFTPLIGDDGRRNRRPRRKSEGDDMSEDFESEESSDMEWDSNDEDLAVALDASDSDRRRGSSVWDDEEDDEDEEEDLYGEAGMRRKDADRWGGEETVVGTLLFTMPFVFALKIYHICSSVFMFPVTRVLRFLSFEVDKAPDTHSVREKKQAASILLLVSILPMTPIIYMWTFFFLIFPFTTLPTAAYIAWMLYWDEAPRDGSRKPLLKDVPFAKYFVEYFPITLSRKSAQLDPSKKYVFAYHPHGIIGLGAFGAFATHAAGFQEKFPGLDMRLLTLDNNFKVPIIREVLLGFGVCSCSRKACDKILGKGPGSAITLVVGGAAESLETQKGTYRLVLGRKGFVQVAVDNDAELVPVIAFGETDAFETFSAKPGTLLRDIQVFIQRKIKFTVPIFWGRGIFNTNFGLMPKRRPIHVFTGEPLSIKPFRERGLEGEALVDAVHKAYIAALRRLFDENKDACEPGVQRKESLTIIK